MCCGNCSVGENFLAKFEGYPAIIGIINMKLTNFVLVYLTFNCDLDLELTHGQHGLYTSPS